MFRFEPSADEAARRTQDMHEALGDSVFSLAQQASHVLPSLEIERVANWRQDIRCNPSLSAETFGAYYDLVDALERDAFSDAKSLFDEILTAPRTSAPTRIRSLGRDYSERVDARFRRYMGSEKTGVSGIAAPEHVDQERFSKTLNAALSLVSQHRPELAAEFQNLIRDIILVAPDCASNIEFEGGTSFKLWGALFLNAECTPSAVQLAVTLAHEEGHAVLFGACRSEMLVDNSDEERFWSPIRQSPRPLEGIFHATFVSARMMDLLLVLRRGQGFSVSERAQIESDLKLATQIYREGVEMVGRHARFTSTGKTVFDAMRGSIAAQFVGA